MYAVKPSSIEGHRSQNVLCNGSFELFACVLERMTLYYFPSAAEAEMLICYIRSCIKGAMTVFWSPIQLTEQLLQLKTFQHRINRKNVQECSELGRVAALHPHFVRWVVDLHGRIV